MKKLLPAKLLLFLAASTFVTAPSRATTGTWNTNPANGDWNVPTNWSSLAVPNGPADVASFGLSSINSVFLSANTQLGSMVFNPGASAYTFTARAGRTLTIGGAGVVNNSGITQTLVADVDSSGASSSIRLTNNAVLGSATRLLSNGSAVAGREGAMIDFRDAAKAGAGTLTANGGAVQAGLGGNIQFTSLSSASNATLVLNGGIVAGGGWGHIDFYDRSSAAQAIVTNNGAAFGQANIPDLGGELRFWNNATAAEATITNHAGQVFGAGGSITRFQDNSTAASATIINNGGKVERSFRGATGFYDNSTAADSLIINNGAAWGYHTGGSTLFQDSSSAGAATVVANNGPSDGPLTGGSIHFAANSSGGTARIEVLGNGFLEIGQHAAPGVTIGSLEGTGTVFLGGNTLTIGSNNRSTEFSGVIRNGGPFGPTPVGGSIAKVGAGTLILSGQNAYSGLTTVSGGKLIINGSVPAPVAANGGILGGTGTIGAADVTAGATLAPGHTTGVLHVVGDLTLKLGAAYLVELNGSTAGSDYGYTAVAGGVSLDDATLALVLGFQPPAGMSFTVIDNDGSDQVVGVFAGLSDGATFVTNGQTFAISYQGGSGNDVVVTVVPEPGTWLLFGIGVPLLLLNKTSRRTHR